MPALLRQVCRQDLRRRAESREEWGRARRADLHAVPGGSAAVRSAPDGDSASGIGAACSSSLWWWAV